MKPNNAGRQRKSTNHRRASKWIAYHEAGHAVLADYFDALESVSLNPAQQLAGHALVYNPHIDDAIMAVIHWGGVLAQARYEKTGIAAIILIAGSQDMEFVRGAAANHPLCVLGHETGTTIKEGWRREARKLLYERWAGVEAVAMALVERKRLNKTEVRRLVKEATGE